ncbi:MAG: hypothetical protein R2822_10835 [Spirosomataceae bacterium]
MLSYGWYIGYLGYALLVKNPVVKNFYGDVPALKAQLKLNMPMVKRKQLLPLQYLENQLYGPIVESDILNGGVYDVLQRTNGLEPTQF